MLLLVLSHDDLLAIPHHVRGDAHALGGREVAKDLTGPEVSVNLTRDLGEYVLTSRLELHLCIGVSALDLSFDELLARRSVLEPQLRSVLDLYLVFSHSDLETLGDLTL